MYKIILSFIIITSGVFHAAGQKTDEVKPAFPGIFSNLSNIRDLAISFSGDEMYFTLLSPQEEISAIGYAKKLSGTWSKPELMAFSGSYRDLEPFLSPDGLRLYFASNRPLGSEDKAKNDFDIWYVKRENKNSEWSEPINPGPPVNTEYDEFYPSLTAGNSLYFTGNRPDSRGKDDIYRCEWKNNAFNQPESLPDSVNSEGYEFNAFIAPDECYLIFSGYNRSDGSGSGDLYISFKTGNSSWTKARNLGPAVNSRQMDYCPFVDTGTGILYFTSKRSNLELRHFKTIGEFNREINSYQNGFSRIYMISLEGILKEYSPSTKELN